MRHQKKIDRAEQVIRTSQLNLFFLREIAQVKKAESSISDQNAHGTGILAIIRSRRRLGTTIWIGFTSARQWTRNMISSRAQNMHLDSFHRKSPSRLHDDMGMTRDCLLV